MTSLALDLLSYLILWFIFNTNCILKWRLYMEEKFSKVKAKNAGIPFGTARLFNAEIWKFYS